MMTFEKKGLSISWASSPMALGLAARKRPRGDVRHVAELHHRGLHPGPRVVADEGVVVDDAGHGRVRDARDAGDIEHRRPLRHGRRGRGWHTAVAVARGIRGCVQSPGPDSPFDRLRAST